MDEVMARMRRANHHLHLSAPGAYSPHIVPGQTIRSSEAYRVRLDSCECEPCCGQDSSCPTCKAHVAWLTTPPAPRIAVGGGNAAISCLAPDRWERGDDMIRSTMFPGVAVGHIVDTQHPETDARWPVLRTGVWRRYVAVANGYGDAVTGDRVEDILLGVYDHVVAQRPPWAE